MVPLYMDTAWTQHGHRVVKLANQESDLVSLLKKLPLGPKELSFVCEKGELLSQGSICRGDSVLPLMLASFLFDTLCSPDQTTVSPEITSNRKDTQKKNGDTQNEELGFKAALAALGAKVSVSEVDHPMLCEGTRRQRGDLALSMLLYCKDNPTRLRQVMRKFLDKGRYNSLSHKERKKTVERETKEDPNIKEAKSSKENSSDTRQRGRTIPSKKGPRNREGSSISSPDSSSCSDSSQGSSNNSSRRGQGKSTRQNSRPTVSVSEVCHGNESGSSSGVDADVGISGTAGSDTNDSFEPAVSNNETITIRVQEVKVITTSVSAPQVVSASRPSRVNFTFPEPTQRHTDVSVPSPTQQVSSQIEGLNISGFDSSSNAPSSDSDYCGPEPSLSSGPESAPLPCASDEGPSRPESPITSPIETGETAVSVNIPEKSSGDNTPCEPTNTKPVGLNPSNNALQSGVAIPFVGSISLVPNLPSYTSMLASPAASNNASPNTFSTVTSPLKEDKVPCSNEEWGEGDAILDKVWCGEPLTGNQQIDVRREDASPHLQAQPEREQIRDASGWNETGGWGCVGADLQWAGSAVLVERGAAEPSVEGHEGDGEASAAEEGGRWRGTRGRRVGHARGRKKKDQRNEAYQATEAEAHYMFELAKTVLSKAGGNVNTSLFTQPSTSSHQVGPHRALHMCAFEIGLFALGLHNRYSPNWLSRTYSSHVSWISGQAMEIGTAAIKLLLQQWEGNLTPSEAAGIADRASKSNDPAMVRAATELALSSLHMAHTLNPGEIDRAVEQCHNEDLQLLEKACIAVEKAAYGGGVYPEKLFDVAKEWYYIYEKTQSKSSKRSNSNSSSPSSPPFSPSYPFSYPTLPLPFTTPEQYVQQQMHQQVQHLLGQRQSTQRSQFPVSYPFQCARPNTTQFPLFFAGFPLGYNPVPAIHVNRGVNQMMTPVSYHLHSSYRVGMLALDSLARRNPDDRPAVRFARNPHCSDRIKWLCTLSAKLGPQYLQRFCVSALNAVQSPYVLHDLAMDAARHMARGNPTQIGAQLRSPAISPLVQKAMTNYAQCVHHQLFELKQAEYDDFIDMLKHAQGAFLMAPGGMSSFNDLLQNIRRGNPKKKELWQKIITEMTRV